MWYAVDITASSVPGRHQHGGSDPREPPWRHRTNILEVAPRKGHHALLADRHGGARPEEPFGAPRPVGSRCLASEVSEANRSTRPQTGVLPAHLVTSDIINARLVFRGIGKISLTSFPDCTLRFTDSKELACLNP